MSIILDRVSHVYMEGGPFESYALKDVSFEIGEGEFVGLIGHTGSGKSTLVQHLNGLLKPSSGSIRVFDHIIEKDTKQLKALRQKVGLVFQYPEHQLFEETVYEDIAFGPKNLKCSAEEIRGRVVEAMDFVGLDYESVKDRSPFELSGGQRRRVAIAGVLAMKPEILILDEPTAGLDPRGREEILGQIARFHKEKGMTIILVSHSMEDIARLVDRLLVMNKGQVVLDGSLKDVFKNDAFLESIGLSIPRITSLVKRLRSLGMDIREDIFTVEDAKLAIMKALRGDDNA